MAQRGARPEGRLALLLRSHRAAAGLTQRQLAARAGISTGALEDLEQGRTRRPRPESLSRLAAALGLTGEQRGELTAAPDGAHARAPAPRAGPAGRRAVHGPGRYHPDPDGPPRPRDGLWLSVLGPLAAWRDGVPVGLGPARQRAVLGLLALHAGAALPRAALVDALWPGGPPPTSVIMVQAQISRIRRLLAPGPAAGAAVVSWDGAGYRLSPGAAGLDLTEFTRLAAAARQAAGAGDGRGACARYERALGLWRGRPLDGVEVLRGHPAVTGLARQRDAVVIEYASAAAGAGLPEQVIGHLEALTAREPLDERAHAWLMITLAATGRQAAALRHYTEITGRLDRELGVSPGPELAEAHLRVLRQQMPGRAAALAPAGSGEPRRGAPAPPVPRQLPGAVPRFAGRHAELAALNQVLDQAAAPAGTVVISAIGGTAGVGKTALAVHWAHQVADRFPDGQLHVNLRGHGPDGVPLAPAAAVRFFLEVLGVPAEQIPADPDAQAALYRSTLADRRMLVVLDNARDAAQARPLLPGTPSCLVLVTSRNELTGLAAADGAHQLTLDVLSYAEAHELLAGRLGAERVAADPAATAELIRRCARLPLALSIAAARAADRPALPLTGVIAELRGAGELLGALGTGAAATDVRTVSVRTVFAWSYQQLTEPAARMFRLLGVHPGVDISQPAAASLAGLEPGPASRALAELCRAHLVTAPAPGRFTCHDLLRGYAAGLAAGLDGPVPAGRLPESGNRCGRARAANPAAPGR